MSHHLPNFQFVMKPHAQLSRTIFFYPIQSFIKEIIRYAEESKHGKGMLAVLYLYFVDSKIFLSVTD